ncbi:RNA polymerase sigma factor [Kitasatospora sp. NPDC057198]|uniref:RNA polymerase sigma factor n=1 Tax=Kitasatospora sp. NPDC057198 TaxID=3346046 RepID=UPI003631F64E
MEALMPLSDPVCLACDPREYAVRAVAGAHADPMQWCGSCWRLTSAPARFYLLQKHRITAYVQRRAGHLGGQVVEDIVQETFMEVLEGMDRMRHPERVQFTIARRVIYRTAPEYTGKYVSYVGELPEDAAPESEVSAEERVDIEKALEIPELTEKERAYLVDHKMYGDSAAETARRHGVSKGAITRTSGRGVTKLRESRWFAIAEATARWMTVFHELFRVIEQILHHL